MEIFFSVGEPSGDQHAAHLIHELKTRSPGIRCTGFGGEEMEAAGCELNFRLTDLAVMGFFRILPMVGKFYRVMKQAEKYFAEHKPDAVVLVDFPGFNWWIARKAKAAGIPVFYYLPPQIWAWASWRVERMRKFVDHVICSLPFEPEWYAKHNIDVDYVGHPFFDEVAEKQLDEYFCREQRASAEKIVAILPGSRGHEVKQNFDDQLRLIERWAAAHPEVKFLVANYRPNQMAMCQEKYAALGKTLPIEFHLGRTSEILSIADCCQMVSGSVSLEVLARNVPAVVTYRCSYSVALLGKLLIHVKYMSLPNLFVDRVVLPEFYHVGSSRQKLAEMERIVSEWLSHPEVLAAKRQEMADLQREVGLRGATQKTAELILSKLSSPAEHRRAA